MKNVAEKLLIFIAKRLKIDLIPHAHVQIGAGHNTYNSGEEYVVKEMLKKIFKTVDERKLVFFDVGGHHGDYALMLRAHFIDAKIISFEPVKKNFDIFIENTKNKNIFCHNVGLSNAEGTFTMFTDNGSGIDGSMTTFYKETIIDIFKFEGISLTPIECNFIKLDVFIENTNQEKINFLKIDVEGHEIEVLKSASKAIEESKIDVIQFEFNEFNISSRSFMKDFYFILKNYDFYRVMPNNSLYPMGEYTSALEIFRYQNILAISKNVGFIYE